MPQFTGPLSHHIHSTTPISYSTSQKWINAYTARSQTHPHMHPDAQLGRSLAFGTHGPTGGITLSQLRKLARGLGGERVTPEPEEKPKSNDKALDSKIANGKRKRDDLTTESEWEDPEVWAGKQGGVEVGEMGERSNFVEMEGETAPEVVGVEEVLEEGGGAVVSKEERKRAKKERNKRQQAEEMAKRRKGGED